MEKCLCNTLKQADEPIKISPQFGLGFCKIYCFRFTSGSGSMIYKNCGSSSTGLQILTVGSRFGFKNKNNKELAFGSIFFAWFQRFSFSMTSFFCAFIIKEFCRENFAERILQKEFCRVG